MPPDQITPRGRSTRSTPRSRRTSGARRWSTVDGADFGLAGAPSAFKLELLQHAGSFKARGAFANLLTRDVPPAGVVAASGGNHGAAVAFAAHAARRAGADLRAERRLAREDRAHPRLRRRAGGRRRSLCRRAGRQPGLGGDRPARCRSTPSTSRRRCSARARVALELEAQAPQLDTLLVAVGGGGLIGGIAAWYRRPHARSWRSSRRPRRRCTWRCAAGHPVDAPAGGIAADSLAPQPGRQS